MTRSALTDGVYSKKCLYRGTGAFIRRRSADNLIIYERNWQQRRKVYGILNEGHLQNKCKNKKY